MADTYGPLTLPVTAPGDPPNTPDLTPVTQDPTLDILLAYLKAGINAQLTTAWQKHSPNELPVKFMFSGINPELGPAFPFNDKNTPALFAFRKGGPAPFDYAAELRVSDDLITILWVPSNLTQDRARLWAPIVGALCKVVDDLTWNGRHPAYQKSDDTDTTALTVAADTDAIKLSIATSASPQTYSGAGLNGSVGTSDIDPKRAITITLGGTAGDFDLGSTITVTGTNVVGLEQSEVLTIASVPSALTTSTGYAAVTAIDVDAQAGTGGTIEVGTGAFTGRGTVVLEALGALRMDVTKQGVLRGLKIMMAGSTNRTAGALNYNCVEFGITVRELRTRDPAVFTASTGATFSFLRSDGSVIETDEPPH